MFESVKKFLKKIRRQKTVERKKKNERRSLSLRAIKKSTARNNHISDVFEDQAYGVTLADGSITNIENRWVRKQLFRGKSLFRHDRPKTLERKG